MSQQFLFGPQAPLKMLQPSPPMSYLLLKWYGCLLALNFTDFLEMYDPWPHLFVEMLFFFGFCGNEFPCFPLLPGQFSLVLYSNENCCISSVYQYRPFSHPIGYTRVLSSLIYQLPTLGAVAPKYSSPVWKSFWRWTQQRNSHFLDIANEYFTGNINSTPKLNSVFSSPKWYFLLSSLSQPKRSPPSRLSGQKPVCHVFVYFSLSYPNTQQSLLILSSNNFCLSLLFSIPLSVHCIQISIYHHL